LIQGSLNVGSGTHDKDDFDHGMATIRESNDARPRLKRFGGTVREVQDLGL
jgi:hypothetical protein